jgi:serine/threonine protein phosphatase PrpC
MPWQALGASVKGGAHEKQGLSCQDAYYWWFHRRGRGLLIAVADGAGSAPKADKGARRATKGEVGVLAGRWKWWGIPSSYSFF